MLVNGVCIGSRALHDSMSAPGGARPQGPYASVTPTDLQVIGPKVVVLITADGHGHADRPGPVSR